MMNKYRYEGMVNKDLACLAAKRFMKFEGGNVSTF